MSEPQIIKLKKEIQLLKEHNAELQVLLEEKNLKIGEVEKQNLNIMNRSLSLEEEKKLVNNSEKIRKLIENAILEEKEITNKYKEESERLTSEVQSCHIQLQNFETYCQKIELENTRLKEQLIEFGKQHEANDYIKQIERRDKEIVKAGEENEKTIRDWNNLCDKMEEVLSENRVLRQIADVPENFGIDISKIYMGDRVKIEDYKAKIRVLQHDIDELETERAQLKHRIEFMASAFQTNEPPFNLLTAEQKVDVANYAQKLFNGQLEQQPEKYDLLRKVRDKDKYIKDLENEISNLKIRLTAIGPGIRKNNVTSKEMEEVMKLIKDQQNEMKILINSKDFSNSGKFKATNNNINNNFTANNLNQNININTNTNINNNNLWSTTTNNINFINGQNYNQNNNNIIYEEFSLAQLPPIPLHDINNPDNTIYSASYRFNTKFKIQQRAIHELFGVALDDSNPDDLKRESASLQSQLIELIEIETRRNQNDEYLQNNLKAIYNKLENLVLIQNEIFKRYMEKNKSYDNNQNDLNFQINNLRIELETTKKINDEYDQMMSLLDRANSSSSSDIMNELKTNYRTKVNENVILEKKLMKLKRKYDCLVDEEKKLREYVELNDKTNNEREKNLKDTIVKLKEWKSLLAYYLRFLNGKLKNSVDKDKYDLLFEENKYLREKTNELVLRDISVTREMCLTQTMMLKYKDLEDSFFQVQEGKFDAEIEMNYIQKRLQDLDPNYFNEQRAFRKLVNKLAAQNLSFEQIRNAFVEPVVRNSNDDKKKINGNIYDDYYFLKGLTTANSLIPKAKFEECIRLNIGLTEKFLTKADLTLIYRALNCEEDQKVDLRKFLKKIEQNSTSGFSKEIDDNKILEDLIKCLQQSNKSLLEIFEFFDQNNNGCITREEFIYALNQLGFHISDNGIDKLILIVSGENPVDKDINIHKLDNTDTFNYVEFCDLFEQKSKNYLLKQKRNILNKNKEIIDWRTNLLTNIYTSMQRNYLNIDEAFYLFDKTQHGFLSYEEFYTFIDSINFKIEEDKLKKLFLSFFPIDNQDLNNKIPIETLKETFYKIAAQLKEYKKLTDDLPTDEKNKIDVYKKYYLLLEEKKYFNIKLNSMDKKCTELQKNNEFLTNQVNDYAARNKSNIDKYFKTMEELQQMKLEYQTTGVRREDYVKIQTENDSLAREVTILRIGMNTFKELYNSCNFQVKQFQLNETRNLDELDTYKKALKELQGESNQNSLIGKLYYTILVGRWREATTLKKYDEAITDISSLKQENFKLETDNKKLTQDLTEAQSDLHQKIIESIKMLDELENFENGIVAYTSNKDKIHPMDEMKKLVEMLKEDKKANTEQLLKYKKKILSLENDKDFLENQIDFCESLANNIKFNNRDEYSKKLISLSEEIAQLKLNNNQIKREYNFNKENINHLNILNEQLTISIKDHEKKSIEWENKYRKMEELYKRKDEEKQKKLIQYLEKIKLYDTDKLKSYDENNNNSINLSQSKEKENIINKNIQIYKEKIKQLNNVINQKDDEIQRLSKINEDNKEIIKNSKDFINNFTVDKLIGKEGLNIIKDEERNLMAKTAHQTIKTLQDIINQKSNEINLKNKRIDEIQDELNKTKIADLQRIKILEDQIKDNHQSAIKKLENALNEKNNNLLFRINKNENCMMTINEFEKLLADKDKAIRTLEIELQTIKNENNKNYTEINNKNKIISDLEDQIKLAKLNNQNDVNMALINKLKNEMKSKSDMIEEERAKIQEIKKMFLKQYQDKSLFDLNGQEKKKENENDKNAGAELNKDDRKNLIQINKLNKEKKLLNKKISDLETERNNLKQELSKYKEDKKNILELQVKDTKKISNLKNEKEKLKKENEKLKDDINKLNQRLSIIEQDKEKFSQTQKYIPQINIPSKQKQEPKKMDTKIISNESLSVSGSKNLKKNIIIKEEQPKDKLNKQTETNLIDYGCNNDEILQKLIYFCLKNNINIKKQLNRYDIAKTGKINETDFMHAIEELRFGFIEYELIQLVNMSKTMNSNDIIIENFVNIMKNKDKNYREFLERQSDGGQLIDVGNKQVTKKYDRFEKKPFNIDYGI